MKTRKLIEKLDRLLNADRREQLAHHEELQKLMAKLRKRRDALKEELRQTDGKSAKQRIKEDIQVLKLQRKKGLALISELKESSAKN